jgi:adenylyltransferase/sulfurtransferase
VAAALRLLVGWEHFEARIQTLDIWTGASKQISAGARDPECHVCGARQFQFLEGNRRVPVSLCGRNAVQLHDSTRALNLEQLATRLRPLGEVRVNEFALRVMLPKYQLTFFPDGRAIIKGTTDVGVARSVYAQMIGG